MGNNAIRNGLYMGGALVLLYLALYFVSPKVFLSWGSWISFAVYIYFMYNAAKEERASLGGYMSFGEGFKAAFLAFVVGGLISALFTYVMYNFIDPTLIDLTKEIALEAFEKMSGFMGEEAAETAMETIEDQDFSTSYSIGNTLMGYLFSLIFPGAVIALIIAAIMKRTNNNYA